MFLYIWDDLIESEGIDAICGLHIQGSLKFTIREFNIDIEELNSYVNLILGLKLLDLVIQLLRLFSP